VAKLSVEWRYSSIVLKLGCRGMWMSDCLLSGGTAPLNYNLAVEGYEWPDCLL